MRLKPAENGCTLGAGCRALRLTWLLCRSAWSMSGAETLSSGSYTGMPNLVSVQLADHSCICPRLHLYLSQVYRTWEGQEEGERRQNYLDKRASYESASSLCCQQSEK